MESSQARGVLTKLMKVLTLKPHHPVSRAAPSSCVLQMRLFSDIKRPITENESIRSNEDDDGATQHIPKRPLSGRRPFNPSFRETEGASFDRNGSSFQSPNAKFAPDPTKKREGSQSDFNFLEKFKLGLENKRERVPSESEAMHRKEHEEKLSPPEDADEIFKKMKETGLIPNAVAMLDGLCKDGLIQEAMKLFGLMREKGTIPEVVIYTAVVDGFCKAHKLEDAKRIFRKMQSKAGHSPSVTTFVGLVDGLCKEKSVEEAVNAIGTLKQKGFLVNDKAVGQFLDKKAPFSPLVWEAIFGKKTSQKAF
ncbi:hypothetical protein ES319_A13G068500v1 [Gossypium barbadense]|uniref:Pentacotripeptide-repeat region of PRORP domain-containing protein n=3 Tax=Gossypium TaxID=3633 RepID=A0A5J5SZ64_GOSBA|nr:hypothetical protein ES319_A13G068500v1 [Gossypium barbadense]TYG85630.1 hypothetical protein ES288_A13G070400v1 [Gossypium darwinii]TYH90803.1 hypothetical protein ES332_A13G073500v1 [Gossypium tomentosum]